MDMTKSWLPVVLCVLLADLNFWYWVSTGENDAEYAGIAFFAIWAAIWIVGFFRRRSAARGVAALGAICACVLMVFRETGSFDAGYIPPYLIFIVSALAGAALGRRDCRRHRPSPGESSREW